MSEECRNLGVARPSFEEEMPRCGDGFYEAQCVMVKGLIPGFYVDENTSVYDVLIQMSQRLSQQQKLIEDLRAAYQRQAKC